MGPAPPNVLSFDVEDWYQLACRRVLGARVPVSRHVLAETGRVLDALGRRELRATFFVVGRVAEAFPALVRRMRDEGHEVASHGYDHRRVDGMTPAGFAADLERSVAALEGITGSRVLGYRAPEFSVGPGSRWAFEAIARAGLRYDSSVVPARGRRYGVPGAPRRPFAIPTAAGPLMELPIATARMLGRDLPAGGGYLRVLRPGSLRRAVRRLNAEGAPAVMFLHPYELGPGRLSLGGAPGAARSRVAVGAWTCRRNLGRGAAERRLRGLVEEFAFVRAVDALDRVAPVPVA